MRGGGPRGGGGAAGSAGSVDRLDRRSLTQSLSAHGRYTVLRKLAEGGMAEIFLARQQGSEGFERQVVLKRIHTAFFADDQFRNMLVDEAHISMSLHHNNIVQVLDLGRSGGRLFLVLELIDGWDLQRILERATAAHFPLPPGLGLYLLAEVCRALAYAHGRTRADGQPMGIVHRDVSPQNVLVSEQGEVKLADFGIAKALTKRDRTATGVVKGKVAFMSPEQALGQPIDARSDLFSFGTMVYLVTTGVRPFDAATDFEVIARVQRGVFTPPEEVRPDLSLALASIIRRAMSVDREQRYQTADELLVDLEGIWRSEFGAPGQTELKLWLAELARRDGELPIGRAPSLFGRASAAGGAGDLAEGQALVLGDERAEALPERDRGPRGLPPRGLDEADDLIAGGVDSGVPPELGRLDTLAAVEVRGPANEPTYVIKPGSGPARARDAVSGIEETSINDLSLPIGDEVGDPYREGTGRQVIEGRGNKGWAFVAFLIFTVGTAAVLWRYSATRDPAPVAAPVETPAAPPPPAAQARPPARPAQARQEPPRVVPPAVTPPPQAPPPVARPRERDRRPERPSTVPVNPGGWTPLPLPPPIDPNVPPPVAAPTEPAPASPPVAPAPVPPESTSPPAPAPTEPAPTPPPTEPAPSTEPPPQPPRNETPTEPPKPAPQDPELLPPTP